MAQTNYTPIILYNSGTTGNTPSTSNLVSGELAINYTDGKLFYKDNSSTLQVIGWKTTPTTAGGTGLVSYTAGDLSYYSSGTALSKLGIGTSGYVLQSNGSAPVWVAQSTLTVGNATNAVNVGTTDNTSSASTYYPTLVSATSGNNPITTSSTKLSFVPSTGVLSANGVALTGNLGTVTSVAALTLGTTGTDLSSSVATGTTTPVITLNVPTASSTNRGALSSTDWTTFNNKAPGVTFTTGYIPYGQGTTTLNQSSNLYFDGSNLLVGTTTNPTGSNNQIICAGLIASGAPTSTGYSNVTSSQLEGFAGRLIANHVNGTGSGALYAGFGYNGGGIGSISQSGTTGVLYNITSDRRLKSKIESLTNSGTIIDSLLPRKFTWNEDGSEAMGFITDEYQQVFPNAITGEPNAVDEKGNPIYQQGDFSTAEFMAVLVAEIQSLRVRLKAANIA